MYVNATPETCRAGTVNVDALRTSMRQATIKDHHGIDHHPLLNPLVRPGLTLDHYGRVLMSFYWIYVHLHERLLDGLERLGQGNGYQPSNRLSWLDEDLLFLELVPLEVAHPLADWRLPPIDSAAQLIGELYVIEGSTLGGQVIARLLRDGLGITAVSGGRFFHGNGELSGVRWNELWAFAERLLSEADMAACGQAARFLFCEMNSALTLAHEYWEAKDRCPPGEVGLS